MHIFYTKTALLHFVNKQKSSHKKIGLVPTMGALHRGHLSLIKESKLSTDITIVSIFVNPIQFNDKKDFEHYPQPILEDLDKLLAYEVNALFYPSVQEIYDTHFTQKKYDLGNLENIFEGAIRPGHYQGVSSIVEQLLKLSQADIAFFGQKDYQQVVVINKMVTLEKIQSRIKMCTTIRDENNIALSSRNIKLKENEKTFAKNINICLQEIKHIFKHKPHNLTTLKNKWHTFFKQAGFNIDYLEIVNALTLTPLKNLNEKAVILIAVKFSEIRLLDNLLINE